MPMLPSNWLYKDSYYWAPDGSGPYSMTSDGSMVLAGLGVILDYTAAQLTALAAAGGLTPYATYVASDTEVWYRATSASVLVAALTAAQAAALARRSTSNPLSIQLKKNSRALTCGWQGRFKSVATSGVDNTIRVVRTLETHTDWIRIGIINCVPANIVNVKVLLSSIVTLPAAGANLGPFIVGNVTRKAANFSGAAAGTVNAGIDTNAVAVTWTDWTFCGTVDRADGGTLPLIEVSIEIPGAGNANRPAWYATTRSGWETARTPGAAPYGRNVMVRQAAVLSANVGTPTLITSTAFAGDGTPFLIQYIPRNADGYTVYVVGDSLFDSAGTTVLGFGPLETAAWAANSTMQAPIEICNMAAGSTTHVNWATRHTATLLGSILPELVSIPVWTPNGVTAPTVSASVNTGNILSFRYNIQSIEQVCAGVGARVLLNSTFPMLRSAADVSGLGAGLGKTFDTTISYLNTMIQQYASGSIPFVNTLTPTTGSVDGNGQPRFPDGGSPDGLHASTAVTNLAAAALAPALASAWW